MGGVSALFCRGRSEYRADRSAGGHLSGRVGNDAVADRRALRSRWAQGHDCRRDAAPRRSDRVVATAPRIRVVGTHDGSAWAGTALVYPTLLAAVADVAHPNWRASAVGVYRLWRDSGYAIGALLAGVLADLFGISWAIGVIAAVTFLSGVIVQAVMA